MNQEDLAAIGQRFIEALRRVESGEDGAAAAMAELFSDDARITNAALRLAGREHQGREGAKIFWEEYQRSIGRARSNFLRVTTGDRAVGLFWKTALEGEGDAEAGGYDGATLLMLDDDGRIRRFHGYYDTRQLVSSPVTQAPNVR